MNDLTELDLLAPLGKVDPPDHDTMRDVAALLAAETDLMPSRSRRFGKRTLVIGGALAAAAAVLAVVGLVGSSTEAPQRNSAQPGPSLRDVVLSALDTNADSILHVTITAANSNNVPDPGAGDLWYSSAQPKAGQSLTVRDIIGATASTFEQDSSETYVVPSAGSPPANCDVLQVQYRTRLWARHVGDCPFLGEPQLELKQEIAEGRWQRVPGQTTVDGQPAVVYTQEADGDNSKGVGNSEQTLWINASTGLPILDEMKGFNVDGSVEGTVTTSFSFLPNTEQNRAQLTVPIPAGFTQVSTFPPTKH
ncbi:MAG TPA: hypothetical protein VJ914_12780 [Pseudonocardiaceae bacterium]|nr:hypothetical protein [Pseudonocardiaceae bacterium]